MSKTRIEWTEETWNPVKGCNKVSEGCKNCYAEVMANRLKGMGLKGYENGFNITLFPERLNQPLLKKNPSKFFVNSMGDTFHEEIPTEYIDRIFETIQKTPQHIYQVLTKRADRMLQYLSNKDICDNLWIGVTVENCDSLVRIDRLRVLEAGIKFLSVEPLLEDLGVVDFSGIDWVIVGGESGARARAMKEEWVLNIKRQCEEQGVAFFFKQWGTWGVDGKKRSKKANGRMLLGKEWNQVPV